MTTSPEQFQAWLGAPEGSQIEFKSATGGFHFEKLVDYCVALANEGGGKIILGVSDRRPRDVVGTAAFAEPGRTEAGLHQRLAHRIPVEEYFHKGRRIIIVHVPSRLPGTAWSVNGRYLKRAGDDLATIGDAELKAIFAETGPDFSAEPCPAIVADVDPAAIAEFRSRWARKAANPRIENFPIEQLLTDAELLVDGRLTYAALILFGTRAALGRYLAQAEIVFEYRSSEASLVSPGGFPPGITPENIIDQQNPRNRRLAEALARCGLIERSGQGLNLMVESAIRQSKPLPDFAGSAPHEVRLILEGNVQNPSFVRFLERLGNERLQGFSTHDFLALNAICRDTPLTEAMRARLPGLIEAGAVESMGRGKGVRYHLSRAFYAAIGRKGVYTRRRGLDHETNKALLLRHIRDAGSEGAPMAELLQVLPSLSRAHVKRLVHELARDGKVLLKGVTKSARWFIVEAGEIGS